eukprot:Sdes_comp8998_c0_seq1m415
MFSTRNGKSPFLSVCCLLFLGTLSVHVRETIADDPTTVDCQTHPENPACINYKLPINVASQGVDMNCKMMSFMPSCTLQTTCPHLQSPPAPLCAPFPLLKQSCIDMPGMMGCKVYATYCSNISVVEECSEAVPYLPTTKEATSSISSICKEMQMDACSSCNLNDGTCDLLTTYSNLCIAMPDMSQCSYWSKMCVSTSPLSSTLFCVASSSSAVPMRMFFHASVVDMILFKSWVTDSVGSYTWSWFCVVGFAFVLEMIRYFRRMFDQYLCRKMLIRQSSASSSSFSPSSPPLTAYIPGQQTQSYQREQNLRQDSQGGKVTLFHAQQTCSEECPAMMSHSRKVDYNIFRLSGGVWIQILRSLFYAVEVGQGLLVMLIAMTFNVGLFVGVLVGSFLGFYVFQYTTNSFSGACCSS